MEKIVQQKFDSYPDGVAILLHRIRTLILETAAEAGIESVEETLKWGEPSYLTKNGSTIRFDYKAKSPEQYCIYFNCKTTLVETFRALYGDLFSYDGSRALIFKTALKGEDLCEVELKNCLLMSLTYKKRKHLPLLGA
jgi:hypothetical protein